MTRYRFEVRIHLAGPVLSQAAESREIGIDTAPRLGAGACPALPGNLIRGNLRHAWTRFHEIKLQQPKPAAETLP